MKIKSNRRKPSIFVYSLFSHCPDPLPTPHPVPLSPGFDRLAVFPITVIGNDVFCDLPAKPIGKELQRVTPPHKCSHSAINDARHFVVVGAGPAALAAAETWRAEGFTGRITLLNKEPGLPYDRTKLSKDMSANRSSCEIRPRSWFTEAKVTLREESEVYAVKSAEKRVVLSTGEEIPYDSLLCASGGPARTFREDANEGFFTPGAQLGNIFVLRTVEQSLEAETAIEAVVKSGGSIVIIGTSFIGMEAAAYIVTDKGQCDLTVVGMEGRPFERVLGTNVGQVLQELHVSKGVKFLMNAKATRFLPSATSPLNVGSVELGDGLKLKADIVIIGSGIVPAVSYLSSTVGVELRKGPPGGIIVDENMRAADSIYAAGDVALFPSIHGTQASVRIEHWDVAIDQGRAAARNMLRPTAPVPYRNVPFFWTRQYAKNIRYAGHSERFSLPGGEIIIHGRLDATAPLVSSFIAYYIENNAVAAVATYDKDPYAVAALELFRINQLPTVAMLKDTKNMPPNAPLDLVAFLEKANVSTTTTRASSVSVTKR